MLLEPAGMLGKELIAKVLFEIAPIVFAPAPRTTVPILLEPAGIEEFKPKEVFDIDPMVAEPAKRVTELELPPLPPVSTLTFRLPLESRLRGAATPDELRATLFKDKNSIY